MPKPLLLASLYALAAGAGVSFIFQQAVNANLRGELGSPWWAGLISYLGGTIVSTAPVPENSKGTPVNPGSTAIRMHGSDTVILSDRQRNMAWKELSKQATNQTAPGFEAATGTFVPDSVKIERVPDAVSTGVPSLQPYSFAMVDHSLLIVDPTNKVIADVVTQGSSSD